MLFVNRFVLFVKCVLTITKKKNRARFPCFELSEMFVIDFLLQASNE